MVFVTNDAGLITYLSRDWTTLTGQTLADARNFGWTRVVHPDDRLIVRDLVLKAIHSQCAFSVRYRLRTIDHGFSWVAAGAMPSFGPPERTFLGFFGSVSVLDEQPGDIDAADGDLRPAGMPPLSGSMLERAADHLLAAHSLVAGAASAATLAAVEVALHRLGEDLAGESLADTAVPRGVQ
jgi:hypothetical protein